MKRTLTRTVLCLALTCGLASFFSPSGSTEGHEPATEAVCSVPVLPNCWGTVVGTENPWRLVCQTPCFGSGCSKANVECNGETYKTCVCSGGGGGSGCCDVALSADGSGVCAVGDCGGSCPSGDCGLDLSGDDFFAECD